MTTNMYCRLHLAQFCLEWKIFQTYLHRNSKHTFYVQWSFSFFEKHTVYEIMWKNVVERDKSQLIILSRRIACWIPKATNTYTQYVISVASQQQQWLHERASMLCYTCIYICMLGRISLIIKNIYRLIFRLVLCDWIFENVRPFNN
jgi:hypothetical protein